MSAEEEMEIAAGELRASQRQMDDAMRSYLQELTDTREALERYRVEIEEEEQDEQAKAEERRIEQQIRAGEFGPGIKALQQRMDLQQTTMADVLSGRDQDWSAEALRELFGPALQEAAAEDDDGSEAPPDDASNGRERPGGPGPQPPQAPRQPPRPDDYGGTW